MYGIFTYIWLIFIVNVAKYTSPMDPMGYIGVSYNPLIRSPPTGTSKQSHVIITAFWVDRPKIPKKKSRGRTKPQKAYKIGIFVAGIW